MRIEGPNRAGRAGKAGGAGKARGNQPRFSLGQSEETSAPAQTQTAEDVSGLDALIALQGVEDPLFKKRKAVKRGQSLLTVLEELKADLLAGRVDEGRLERLMALVKQGREQIDPDLDKLIEEIELRAKVELAKLGRY